MKREPTEAELNVAKALYDYDELQLSAHHRVPWNGSDAQKAEYVPKARAAIRSLRTPTVQMIEAAWADALAEDAAGVWREMVDTASPLEESD